MKTFTVAAVQHGAGCSCAYSPITWDRDGRAVDNAVMLADEMTEGLFLATFELEAVRDYRSREMMGNTFRKVRAYQDMLSEEIRTPFIRPTI